jgi:hypothetical protein
MVEQLTLNQRVGGSSPPRFTKSFNDLVAAAAFGWTSDCSGNCSASPHFTDLLRSSFPALLLARWFHFATIRKRLASRTEDTAHSVEPAAASCCAGLGPGTSHTPS